MMTENKTTLVNGDTMTGDLIPPGEITYSVSMDLKEWENRNRADRIYIDSKGLTFYKLYIAELDEYVPVREIIDVYLKHKKDQ